MNNNNYMNHNNGFGKYEGYGNLKTLVVNINLYQHL